MDIFESNTHGFFSINGDSFPLGSVRVKYPTSSSILIQAEDGDPLFEGHYNTIINGNTGMPFATIEDLKTFVNSFFFEAGSSTGDNIGHATTDAGELIRGTLDDARLSPNIPIKVGGKIPAVDIDFTPFVSQIIDSAPSDANTLNKLNNKLAGLQAFLNGNDVNLDTIKELADAIKSDEGLLTSLTSAKLNVGDVYNALDYTIAGKALDARQGRVLTDAIAALTAATVPTSRTINNKPLTANVVLAKADIAGINLVDNTPDAQKPVSGPQASAIAAATKTYFGMVATRAVQPRISGGTGLNHCSARWKTDFKEDVVGGFTAVFPNYYLNNHSDVLNGNGTLKASVECNGVITYANECIAAGNNPVAMNGAFLVLTFNGSFPKETPIYFNTWQQNATGVVWFQYQSVFICPSDESCDIGGGAGTDRTGTLGSFGGQTNAVYGPVLVLAQITKPSVVIVGTSRDEAGPENITDNKAYVGITARSIGQLFGYLSLAEASSTQAQWNNGPRTYRDQIIKGTIPGVGDGVTPYFTHITNEYGVNDISAGDTPAALAARRALFASYYPKLTVIGHTLYPYVPTTDGYATKTNQTLGTNQPKILVFNDLVRAGITGEKFVFDSADAVDPFREGKYPVSRNQNDVARKTTCQFTGSITGSVLTVTAVASGSLNLQDPIADNLTTLGNIQPGTRIISFGTGTGGVGTYNLSKAYTGSYPYPNAVASTTMYVGGFATVDGLHISDVLSLMIRDSGVIKTHLIKR